MLAIHTCTLPEVPGGHLEFATNDGFAMCWMLLSSQVLFIALLGGSSQRRGSRIGDACDGDLGWQLARARHLPGRSVDVAARKEVAGILGASFQRIDSMMGVPEILNSQRSYAVEVEIAEQQLGVDILCRRLTYSVQDFDRVVPVLQI